MIVSALVLTLVAAAPPERLFVTEVRGDDEELATALERAIVEEAAALGYDSMSTAEVQSLVDVETRRQMAGCDDDDTSCLAEIAEGLGARKTITSSLAKIGARYILSMTLLDSVQARVVRRERAESEDPAELLDATRASTRKLLGDDDAAPSHEPAPATGPSVPLIATGAVLAVTGVVLAVVGVLPLQAASGASAAADEAAAGWAADGSPLALEQLERAHEDHLAAAEQWNSYGGLLVAGGVSALVIGGGLAVFGLAE
jgi:hypothetical protein